MSTKLQWIDQELQNFVLVKSTLNNQLHIAKREIPENRGCGRAQPAHTPYFRTTLVFKVSLTTTRFLRFTQIK